MYDYACSHSFPGLRDTEASAYSPEWVCVMLRDGGKLRLPADSCLQQEWPIRSRCPVKLCSLRRVLFWFAGRLGMIWDPGPDEAAGIPVGRDARHGPEMFFQLPLSLWVCRPMFGRATARISCYDRGGRLLFFHLVWFPVEANATQSWEQPPVGGTVA